MTKKRRTKKVRRCRCCGKPIRMMCMVDFCSGRCQDGKCDHGIYE